ncbi:MAG: hypothetical protein OXE97_02930, partial [Gammaproteobacteria bacterium]|nr:hypothetical protein [Gammaproteobacteria bacterium]
MKEIYSWVPWFLELAKKIAKGDLEDFQSKARKIVGNEKNSNEKNSNDPFSFFYFLAAKNNREKLKQAHKEYKMSRDVPTDVEVNTDRALALQSDDHSSLWKLFEWSQRYNDKVETNKYFSEILKIRNNNIGAKTLTQCLFLINPNQFMPIDDRWYNQQEKVSLGHAIEKQGWEYYKKALEEVKGIFPGCEFYEIYRACSILHNSDSSSRKFFQIGIHAGGRGDDDYWLKDFDPNNWVYTGGPGDKKGWTEDAKDTAKNGFYKINRPKPGDIILVRTGAYQGRAIGIVEDNEYAKSEKLDKERRIHVVWINKKEAKLIKRLGQPRGFSGVPKMLETFRETPEYLPTLEYIESLTEESNQEKGALHSVNQKQETDTVKHPLNQILYGPPGTGKTWNTV